jgi:serine/threonine protein phosphatase PrpC
MQAFHDWIKAAAEIAAPSDTKDVDPDEAPALPDIFQWMAPDPRFEDDRPETPNALATPKALTTPEAFATPKASQGDVTPTCPYTQPTVESLPDIDQAVAQAILCASLATKKMAGASSVYLSEFELLLQYVGREVKVAESKKGWKQLTNLLEKDAMWMAEGKPSLRLGRSYLQKQQCPDSYLPLHLAAKFGSIRVMELLLAVHGAEQLQARTVFGETAAHLAAHTGNKEGFEFLQAKYPEPVMDVVGNTVFAAGLMSPTRKAKQNRNSTRMLALSAKDPTLFMSPSARQKPVEWSSLGVLAAAAHLKGSRPFQEDAYCMWLPPRGSEELVGICCVCDGHGDAGEMANFVATNLPDAIYCSKLPEWTDRCAEGSHQVNQELQAKTSMCGGTVSVSLLLTEKFIVVANTGDSRCIFIQKGAPPTDELTEGMSQLSLNESSGAYAVTALSVDHTPDDPGEKKRLQEAGANLVETSYEGTMGQEVTKTKIEGKTGTQVAFSRSFGDFDFSQSGMISTPTVQVLERDSARDAYLVLACDGVWDAKSNEDVGRMVVEEMAKESDATTATLEAVAHRIAEDCLESGDNVTIIIVALQPQSDPITSEISLPVVSTAMSTPQKS